MDLNDTTSACAQRLIAKLQRYTIITPTCHHYTGVLSKKGYGYINTCDYSSGKRKTINAFAHRIAHELAHGPIPNGLCVLHTCDVPCCVNPMHLTLGTNDDNIRDMMRKGRSSKGKKRPNAAVVRGEQHGEAKLNNNVVLTIRDMAASGVRGCDIAQQLGISRQTVSKIVLRQQWKHLP